MAAPGKFFKQITTTNGRTIAIGDNISDVDRHGPVTAIVLDETNEAFVTVAVRRRFLFITWTQWKLLPLKEVYLVNYSPNDDPNWQDYKYIAVRNIRFAIPLA